MREGTSITVVVPTYNAGDEFIEFAKALKRQNANIARVMIIDSSSSDDTAMLVGDFSFEVEVISKANFEHGKTS